MRCQIVAELATGHGGNVEVAADMIRAAADAGADYAKLQSYTLSKLNPNDPQRDWLIQSHLDQAAHATLLRVGESCGIGVYSTPFDADALTMLWNLGMRQFKIASSESGNNWWRQKQGPRFIVSWPWGLWNVNAPMSALRLTAIPLYPTPLEAVERAPLLDGWSDHGTGLAACYRAIALGAQMVEVHLALVGKSRVTAWDKTPQDIKQLRQFAEDCETMRVGVAQKFRDRWRA